MKKYSKQKPDKFKVYSVSLDEKVVNDALEIHNNLSEFARDAIEAHIEKYQKIYVEQGIK